MIGRTEILVVLIAILVLLISRQIPEFAKGLGKAMSEFRKASDEAGGFGVGRGLAGAFGTRVFEALTPDNRTAEIHDPPNHDNDRISRLVGAILFSLALLSLVAWLLFLLVDKTT